MQHIRSFELQTHLPPAPARRTDQDAIQRLLSELNRERFAPARPRRDWESEVFRRFERELVEGRYLEAERDKVRERAETAPRDVDGFVAWFEQLKTTGPGQGDRLFDYIAHRATRDEVRWFVQQEVAGEAGFDDLVALTQLRMPAQVKLELARNYWDEMGRGKENGMHGPMLERLAREIVEDESQRVPIVWEALAVGNLLAGLASQRRYAFHSLGALGAVELTAPTRAVLVAQGLERVGVSKTATQYFRLHSTVDVIHYQQWRDEVIIPLMRTRPELGVALAEGALMRLEAGARSYRRYRRELEI